MGNYLKIVSFGMMTISFSDVAVGQTIEYYEDFSIKGIEAPDYSLPEITDVKPEYDSKSIGKRKRLQLDTGYIDKEMPLDHPDFNDDNLKGYSGFRLRLPKRSK